jgi:hypothetical protein
VTTPTAPKINKLGPGSLVVGSAGSTVDLAAQCQSATVSWKVDTEDDQLTLSGATLAGDRTYTATLEAKLFQDDLSVGGLVDWSWTHKGDQLPFTYTPYSGGRAITGDVIVDPLDAGGDVGKKNTSDIKWGCVGEPTLVDDLS